MTGVPELADRSMKRGNALLGCRIGALGPHPCLRIEGEMREAMGRPGACGTTKGEVKEVGPNDVWVFKVDGRERFVNQVCIFHRRTGGFSFEITVSSPTCPWNPPSLQPPMGTKAADEAGMPKDAWHWRLTARATCASQLSAEI